ncbi:unnamed protein product [Lepeophtheirus salmonis]|uniref:(salmon louse) hypothetical protein n=1 Tax=Lepeophtheirus salmonis TaxID=72036 RepID=A0A7R8CIT7_LEPSM|nr:unnamed protein product [Lepeophtheirus salmonis]CAF2836210.1 unnamed protein product [Lepeophtheirus salmonis]
MMSFNRATDLDIEHLIKTIKAYPATWNNNTLEHKNRIKRCEAWTEIAGMKKLLMITHTMIANIELHDYNENSSEDILEHIKEEEIEWIDNDDIIEVNEEIKEEKDIFRNFELRKSDKFFFKRLGVGF